MIVDGSCHCGAIRYQADVNPDTSIICHCTDCQTISGAPFRVNVAASTRTLQVTGEPKTYTKRGDSGAEVTTAFCGTCGAALYSGKGEAPKFVFLRLGAIRQRADLPPKAQGFCTSAMPWAMDITGIPQVSSKPR
jgi:hypothetical protein